MLRRIRHLYFTCRLDKLPSGNSALLPRPCYMLFSIKEILRTFHRAVNYGQVILRLFIYDNEDISLFTTAGYLFMRRTRFSAKNAPYTLALNWCLKKAVRKIPPRSRASRKVFSAEQKLGCWCIFINRVCYQ